MPRETTESTVFKKYCAVMDALGQSDAPVRLSELARRTGLAKSTAHRILSVLCGEDLLIYDEQRREYRLGLRTLSWAAKSWQGSNITQIADEYMSKLHETTGEHSNLAVRNQDEVMFLAGTKDSRGSLTTAQIGQRAPVHCTAVGKVLAAYLPDRARQELIDRLPLEPHTVNTITDRRAFAEELSRTKERGMAITVGEEFLVENGIAVPIFDFQGQVVAALSIFCLTHNTDLDTLLGWESPLKDTARQISERLGHIR